MAAKAVFEEKYKEGDILKRELTSRQSWTVVKIKGKLMLQPNTNKSFTSTKIIPLNPLKRYIKLANVTFLDFSKLGSR